MLQNLVGLIVRYVIKKFAIFKSFLKYYLILMRVFLGFFKAILVKNASKTLFISGQVGLDPKTNKLVDGGTSAEFEQIVNNIGQILHEANSTLR